MAKKTSPVEVEVVTDRERAAALEAEWLELASQVAAGQFSLPSFALDWWDALGDGRLLLVVARRGGRLVGLLPLHERSYGVGLVKGHVIRWLGHGLGTIGSALLEPTLDVGEADAVAAAMWQALAMAASPRVALQLTEYRSDGGGLAALRLDDSWDVHCELRSIVPTVDLRGRDAANLLAGTANRKLRHTLSTARRDLVADGLVFSTEFVDGADRFEAVLGEIDAVFDAAEAADSKMHLLAGEHRDATLSSLRACFVHGLAVVGVARLDGRAIAFDISVRAGTQLFGYIRRHDPDARRYSPGHLLMHAGLLDAVERGIETFDLGLGTDPYKLRWANDRYDAVVVTGGRTGHGMVASGAVDALEGLFSLRRRVGALAGS